MDATAHGYRIRLARADEVARLREIEDEAGTRFDGLGLIDESLDPSFRSDTAAELVALGQVWVACLEHDLPVAMAITSVRDGAVYLDEMDVVPGHGRRGLGARLLEHVCTWAQARGYGAVRLSTFRDVPWNGPFYRRHGFRELQPAEWSPGMRAIREDEARRGLRVEARVFMTRVLPGRSTWRLASEVDDASVVGMCLGLYREDPGSSVVDVRQIRETLATLRREPWRGRAVVLVVGRKVVGYALLIAYWSNELGGEVCAVDELYVKPDFRSRGLGASLFDAIARGGLWPGPVAALALGTTPGNTRARRLYEKLGFVPIGVSMVKKAGPAPRPISTPR